MAEDCKVKDLVPDELNFNKGTLRGRVLLDRSFQKFGAGRSILIDRNNRIIAGNKSAQSALSQGIDDVRIIETSGNELIAVKRTDIDLSSEKGREMALADNMTSKTNFNLDYNNILQAVQDVQLDVESWKIDMTELHKNVDAIQKEISECFGHVSYKFVFKGFSIEMTEDEYNDLMELAENYFDENGVLIGFIGNLLSI